MTREHKRMADRIDRMLKLFNGGIRWSKGARARDKSGEAVKVKSTMAETFCILGAAERVCSKCSSKNKLRDFLYRNNPRDFGVGWFLSPVSLNDDPSTRFNDVEIYLVKLKEKLLKGECEL